MHLTDLGWDDDVAAASSRGPLKPTSSLGRVVIGFNHIYRVFVEGAELDVILSGGLRHQATSRGGVAGGRRLGRNSQACR